jgi:hypothetical protein
MKLTTTLTLFIALIYATAQAQDTQVTASVSSDTVGVQDQFQLTITVSGRDSGDAENPRVASIQGFKVVSGPNIGSQFQWINGRTSSSKSYMYILIPEKEGQFTINPIEVRAGGKTYRTQPVQVRVTSAPRNSSRQRQSPASPLDPFQEEELQSRSSIGDAVFIRAELDRNSVYPGQQATLSYRVYTQVGISGIQLRESPPLSGFWVEDLEVEKNPKGMRQTINGREYQAFTVKKQALFANTTGKLKIPSSSFAVSTASTGDIFGIFGRSETLYRKTEELTLEVKPLPSQGKPQDFSNAVGTFNLTAGIDKTQAATGEAVGLHVKLEGRGNLKMIPDISMPSLPDFTIYSSKRADNIRSLGENQIGGDKSWEYVIVPKAPGLQTIPSLSFSYFNAEKEKYETVTTPPLTVNVLRGADSTAAVSGLSGSDKQALKRQGTDINFIKLSTGRLINKEAPFYRKLWFYLAIALPLLFNAAVFLYQRQRSKLAGDMSLVRNRKAKQTALKRLKTAEREGRSEARRYYDEAAAALSGYLADKFGLSGIELTADNLERTLAACSVPAGTIEETRACLQECDYGRFVSAAQSGERMLLLGRRIRENIENLEKTTAAV